MTSDVSPQSPAEIVGARIRCLRQARGMTLAQLSDRIGLTGRGNLSNLERGKMSPRLDTLVKIARGLDVPVAFLVVDLDPSPAMLAESLELLAPEDGALAALLIQRLLLSRR